MREQPRVIPGSDEGRPRTNERLLWVLLPPVSSPSIGNNLISIREDSHQNVATSGLLCSDETFGQSSLVFLEQESLSVCPSSRPLMLMMKIIFSNILTEREHKYLHSHYLRCDSPFKTLVLPLHCQVSVKFLSWLAWAGIILFMIPKLYLWTEITKTPPAANSCEYS